MAEDLNAEVAEERSPKVMKQNSQASQHSATSVEGIYFEEKAQEQEHRVAGWISLMELTKQDFLRAVPACSAVWHLMLSCGKGIVGNYHKSRAVKKISRFLSHSWRASSFWKACCLLLRFNWKPAVILGNLGAVTMCLLFSLDLLPGFTNPSRFEDESIYLGVWCQGVGILCFLAGLFLWRPQDPIFLDAMCIDQERPDKKAEGVLNLGGCLRHSKELLVLWDRTYCERLWCIFELAGFLKLHEDSEVLVQPISEAYFFYLLFPLNCLMWILGVLVPLRALLPLVVLGLFVFSIMAASLLLHFTLSVEKMVSQLDNFNMEATQCWCCMRNHKTRFGAKLPCDRKVISKCVEHWFGSIEGFEESVRIKAKSALMHRLGGMGCPFHVLVISNLSLWFQQLDLSATRWRIGDNPGALGHIFVGLFSLLVTTPTSISVIQLGIRWTRRCHKRARQLIAVSLLVAYLVFTQVLYQVCLEGRPNSLEGRAIWAGIMLVPSMLLGWYGWRR